MMIAKFLNALVRKARSTKKVLSFGPKRVYVRDDLGIPTNTGFAHWEVKCIDDDDVLIEKLFYHIRTANDIKVFCTDGLICFTLMTERFGLCKVSMTPSLGFFEFGIYKSGVRYDINYALMRRENPAFVDWLYENILSIYRDYIKDANL